MANRAKIACTLDAELLASVEGLRARTGESRSAVINRALSNLIASRAATDRVARYVQAYREHPEPALQVRAVREQARQVLANLPWDDE